MALFTVLSILLKTRKTTTGRATISHNASLSLKDHQMPIKLNFHGSCDRRAQSLHPHHIKWNVCLHVNGNRRVTLCVCVRVCVYLKMKGKGILLLSVSYLSRLAATCILSLTAPAVEKHSNHVKLRLHKQMFKNVKWPTDWGLHILRSTKIKKGRRKKKHNSKKQIWF